jgi:tRNA nucleotidyltransferase/poly(A) polymerase
MARPIDPESARRAATWIVRRLRDHGHIAYFAGGCVRDGLLALHPTDYDVATDAAPARVQELFPRNARVGAAFGVILVHVTQHELSTEPAGTSPGRAIPPLSAQNAPQLVSVEVATFRSDGPYTDARRPDSVKFSDPESDAQRRDFTINALFLDPLAPADEASTALGGDIRGKVIDYVGGIDDLRRRVLRAVGDPDKRLAEDHLRALRAVRFASRLGFELDAATAAAITRHASDLRGVSRERIGEELRRMLAHPSRAAALATLQRLTLDEPVLTEPSLNAPLRIVGGLPEKSTHLAALAAWILDRSTAQVATGPAIAVLSDAATKDACTRARAGLCLSNDEHEELESILHGVRDAVDRWAGMRVSQRKRLASRSIFGNCLDILRAVAPDLARQIGAQVSEMARDGIGINPPALVTGDDLIAAGFKPSPLFKRILDETRDAQLEGLVRGKAEGLELARRLSV